MVKCSLISCNLLLFARNLFNFIARIWLNCCVCVWLNFFYRNHTLICLIFVEWDLMFFLTILLSPIVFLLWGYTISINSNFFNVIEMCSAMFWIWFMTFGLFITTRNMFSYVLVYGMYVFYLIFLKIRNLFYLFDGCLLCCVRVFKGWIS